MNQHSPRRWLQFGLRTAVVVMLLCALFSGYTAWWMRRLQQSEARAEAALQQAKQARRQAQVAEHRALEAEAIAMDRLAIASQEAKASRRLEAEAAARLEELARQLESLRESVAKPRGDETEEDGAPGRSSTEVP